MKQIRRFINIFLWTVVAVLFAITVLLHIPSVQNVIGNEVASALSKKLGTKVTISRVDLGFLNRVVVDGIRIYDQKGKPMLLASRASAGIDILPLFEGKISISSAQLFGLDATLYRTSKDSPTNFQFLIDSLSSKDTTSHTPLDLRISSIIIRNGKARWDDYEPRRGSTIDFNHLKVTDLSAHILLKHLTDDGIDMEIKRLSLKEASGLDLRQLALKAKADKKSATVSHLTIELPNTKIQFPTIIATYSTDKNGFIKNSLKYIITLDKSYVTPADLAFIDPTLKTFRNKVNLKANVNGTATSLKVGNLAVESDDQSIIIRGNGSVEHLDGTPQWAFNVSPLKTSADGIKFVARNLRKHDIEMPAEIIRLGNIYFKGTVNGKGNNIAGRGDITTSLGKVSASGKFNAGHFEGTVRTPGFQLGKMLDNPDFGLVAADVSAHGFIPSPFRLEALNVTANGKISQFYYNKYTYHNINVDGIFNNSTFNGTASINDPNGKADVKGIVSRNKVEATLSASNLNLHRLKLTDALGNRTFALNAKANLTGRDLNTLNGYVDINNFSAVGEGKNYRIGHVRANVTNDHRKRTALVESDFGTVSINGVYDYKTLPNSVLSIAGRHMPSLFAKKQRGAGNVFSIHADMTNASILRDLFNIPLSVQGPVNVDGTINDLAGTANVKITAPHTIYNGNDIQDADISILSDAEGMNVSLNGKRISDAGTPLTVNLNATAANDVVAMRGQWDVKGNSHSYGNVDADLQLFRDSKNTLGVSVDILPSTETFDTISVNVLPSHLTYSHNLLDISHFEVSNGDQHVIVNGQTTGSDNDSLLVDFRNINLKYILDLVGFDAVQFTGSVTGKGYVKSFFRSPKAYADFNVDDFRFQGGEFGTLRAHATYDNDKQRIDLNSIADDGPDNYTVINGYVSIKDNYIDLPMQNHNTRLEFLEGFAGTVLKDVKATGTGWCRIAGDLSHVNLTGDVYCDGDATIRQTNTTYTLKHSHVRMIPNEIMFPNDTIRDSKGNIGIVTGALHHNELHKMTFDLHVDADNLMCLNLPEFDDNTFRGVIWADGKCDIIGRSGETTINANLTPVGDSYMEYDAGYSGGLDDNTFIHWRDVTPVDSDSIRYKLAVNPIPQAPPEIPGDFVMNLIINTLPNFTLKVLMDETTGDYMEFHGDGGIRATYFNKGSFQMFGNYNVQYGKYIMTIQNLVKKEFSFLPESSVAFGGNPFDARLNLKAQYTVNGVSLADLKMGGSFTSSNIKVNCLMNIQGTPLKPALTFGIDFPTLSTDAQQMVRSVMNTEEDLNQQVLYLLAVGRFYSPGNNNAEVEENASQSQTSLAMQSVLSGALSQQISNIMSTVLHNTNWNIGANISTGEEGLSDAEYEGLLSGRMLNNRLIFEGQFGYRDNVTTNNSSFIGDFDLRYLLTPNGNAAIRVYNQTNDRYFTRNSLTTQGLGFVLKKDFTSWRDLFRSNKKKKKAKKTKKSK